MIPVPVCQGRSPGLPWALPFATLRLMADERRAHLKTMESLLKQLEATKASTEKLIRELGERIQTSRDALQQPHPPERRRATRRKDENS
jgi:hypothetical protein